VRVGEDDGVGESVTVGVGVADGLRVGVGVAVLVGRVVALGVGVAVLVARAVLLRVEGMGDTVNASGARPGGTKERVRMVTTIRAATKPHSLRLILSSLLLLRRRLHPKHSARNPRIRT
jgi:hypothetical protein